VIKHDFPTVATIREAKSRERKAGATFSEANDAISNANVGASEAN
jgi:hypothetical protein